MDAGRSGRETGVVRVRERIAQGEGWKWVKDGGEKDYRDLPRRRAQCRDCREVGRGGKGQARELEGDYEIS